MLLGTQRQLQSSSHRKAVTETKKTLEQNLHINPVEPNEISQSDQSVQSIFVLRVAANLLGGVFHFYSNLNRIFCFISIFIDMDEKLMMLISLGFFLRSDDMDLQFSIEGTVCTCTIYIEF